MWRTPPHSRIAPGGGKRLERGFVADECIGRRIPIIIELCFKNVSVKRLDTLVASGMDGEAWIPVVASRYPDYALLTVDTAMLGAPYEFEAIARSGLNVVFFDSSWMNYRLHERAWRLIRLWPRLMEALSLAGDVPVLLNVRLSRGAIVRLR